MYKTIASHVYKRAVEDGTAYKLPGWAFGVFFADFIVFLPLLLVVSYTLNDIYPVLAMIEDPSPPAYEPVSLNPDDESLAEETSATADEAARGLQDTRAISSSLRALHRTIYAISGWKSYFRGFVCWIALTFSTLFVYGIVSAVPFIPNIIAALISALTLVQIYTAWLHIVISAPSPKPFYRRLPPFKKAFQATALPMALYFAALEVQSVVPKFLARVLHLTTIDATNPGQIPQPDPHDTWKILIILIAVLAVTVLLTIPAHVVLTRVQASLLPEEDETIVPFDRAFQGKLEPAIVGGKGYVSVKDAWQTFSRASWIRLVKLYLKLFAVTFAVNLVLLLVLVPELVFIFKHSQKA
ncbi:hypothetical protein BX600DRAFT_14856 [Xylariales sp. PMI_506]|nr:hypothetical protein BX600DRAFT_14856 [Xylariales sp. PMI_506]